MDGTNKYKYKPLALGELDKFLKDITFQTRKDTKPFIVYTGEVGMFEFNLAMLYPHGKISLNILGYVTRTLFYERVKALSVIHLFHKSGPYKVLLYRDRRTFPLVLMKGTEVLSKCDSTSSLNDAIIKYTNIKKLIMEQYAEMMKILVDSKADFEKAFDKKNSAAGTRVRKAMQDIKTKAQEVRTSVLALKED